MGSRSCREAGFAVHPSVYRWFEGVTQRYPVAGTRVLECGGYDVNGTIRPLFSGAKEYLAIDDRDGPGVDQVVNCHALPFDEGSYDWVVSTSMLEHDPMFWRSMSEMQRVLRPGGLLAVTVPGFGWPHHNDPIDLYRFSATALRLLAPLCAILECVEANDGDGPDVRLLGQRVAPIGVTMVI